MKLWLGLALYNLLLLIFACVDLAKWLIAMLKNTVSKADSNKVKRDWQWGQKFGLLSHKVPVKVQQQRRYLVHCASMGEVISAMPLLRQMVQQHNDLSIVITTNTLTGKTQTIKMIEQYGLSERLSHTYLPIDLPWLVKGLLKKLQIDKLIIMEVELWPNLILAAKSLNKPVAIINGRMTDSSYRGYQRFNWLAQPMFKALNQVFVRNNKDFENYAKLGLTEPTLILAGNIKFDIALPSDDIGDIWRTKLHIQNRLVIVAGSTHDTEETSLLDCYQQLTKQHPKLLMIIAPRHPHRFSEVNELVAQSGLTYINSSTGQQASDSTNIIVLDQMGVLSDVYAAADLVFIGGSIAKKGGHNPIEASAFAKPVIMGQHIYNNPEIINTIADGGGLLKVSDSSELQQALTELVEKQELREQIGQKGLTTIKQNSGVMTRLTEQL